MEKRIVYLILVHTDPTQAYRLCQRLLLDDKSDIYIHVDLKSRHDFSSCERLPNGRVTFISERYPVYWSGFSMILATLALMRAALRAKPLYHHLVLLSGLDYPLRHPTDIRGYFRNSVVRQHINRINALDSQDYYIHQVTRFHFRDGWIPFRITEKWDGFITLDKAIRKVATLLVRPIRRALPVGLVPCEGSQWWALTEECARCLLDSVDQRPELSRLYRYAMVPDEHFFHTLVQNSPFASEAAPISPYSGKGMWKKANFHVINPFLQKICTLNDFEEVMASGKLFVRKVMTSESTPLMDKIDRSIAVDSSCTLNLRGIENVAHRANHSNAS
jgi:hypothetical protein